MARVPPERGEEFWGVTVGSAGSEECAMAVHSGPGKVFKLTPTYAGRPGIDKIVGCRIAESYWSMGQKVFAWEDAGSQLDSTAGSPKGPQGTSQRPGSQGPMIRILTQHHKLAQQEWPSDGRVPMGSCPYVYSIILHQGRKHKGGVLRDLRQPHPSPFTGVKGRGLSQILKF